jgi:hypothetical protein
VLTDGSIVRADDLREADDAQPMHIQTPYACQVPEPRTEPEPLSAAEWSREADDAQPMHIQTPYACQVPEPRTEPEPLSAAEWIKVFAWFILGLIVGCFPTVIRYKGNVAKKRAFCVLARNKIAQGWEGFNDKKMSNLAPEDKFAHMLFPGTTLVVLRPLWVNLCCAGDDILLCMIDYAVGLEEPEYAAFYAVRNGQIQHDFLSEGPRCIFGKVWDVREFNAELVNFDQRETDMFHGDHNVKRSHATELIEAYDAERNLNDELKEKPRTELELRQRYHDKFVGMLIMGEHLVNEAILYLTGIQSLLNGEMSGIMIIVVGIYVSLLTSVQEPASDAFHGWVHIMGDPKLQEHVTNRAWLRYFVGYMHFILKYIITTQIIYMLPRLFGSLTILILQGEENGTVRFL